VLFIPLFFFGLPAHRIQENIKKDIEEAMEDYKKGRVYSMDDVKKSLGI
jgi:hypothetical protein